MVSSWILLLVSIGYAALLFGVAWWGDRRPMYPDRPWLRPRQPRRWPGRGRHEARLRGWRRGPRHVPALPGRLSRRRGNPTGCDESRGDRGGAGLAELAHARPIGPPRRRLRTTSPRASSCQALAQRYARNWRRSWNDRAEGASMNVEARTACLQRPPWPPHISSNRARAGPIGRAWGKKQLSTLPPPTTGPTRRPPPRAHRWSPRRRGRSTLSSRRPRLPAPRGWPWRPRWTWATP